MGATSVRLHFSGHETFACRYPWLKKGVDAVSADSLVFQRIDAPTTFGVGKNMVRAIRHWCLATGVLTESVPSNRGLQVTKLGSLIFGENGLDPYLEDPATLWLLHWQLATNPARAATWFWAFNHFHEPNFTRQTLASALYRWSQTLGGRPVAERSIHRDVDVFLRTYVASRASRRDHIEDMLDSPLVELGLIIQLAGRQVYQFQRGPQPGLPTGVLLYAILRFWEAFRPDSETLALVDIARQPGSPGRVFKIDESSLTERLEGAEEATDGRLIYGETAGLRQLYRRDRLTALDVLATSYMPRGGRP